MNEGRPSRIGRITIRDVAADANVSVAAVSKVLRNAYGVSDTLRRNVMASIGKLGYRPSTAARGMRGRTYTTGVLLVEIGNPFLPAVIAGITETCAAEGYKVLIGIGEAKAALEASLIDSMIDQRMDGLVLVAPRLSGAALAAVARSIPIVTIAHYDPQSTTFDTVNSDGAEGARLAVAALLAEGHRNIGMVTQAHGDAAPEEWVATHVAAERERGYREAMAQAGLAEHTRIWPMPPRGTERLAAIGEFVRAPDRPPAVFCWSDLDGCELVNQARANAIRVPQDLAVIGYDNSPVAAMPLIDLSSIDQDARGLGRAAARRLLDRIGGQVAAVHTTLSPSLVTRTSHRAGPARMTATEPLPERPDADAPSA